MKIFSIIWIGFIAIMAIGWGTNVYKFATCDFEPSYKAEVIRGIGIFVPPVGAIAGYIDLGK